MKITIDKQENIFFGIKIFFTIVALLALVLLINSLFSNTNSSTAVLISTLTTYVIVIVLFLIFQKIYLIGYMKGNGIEISINQFSDVYKEYVKMAQDVGLKKIPKLFILQQGGVLNAFAIRFSGSNYISIYSDVFTLINSDMDSVRFILGHELGHVARKHMSKRFWTCISSIIPFLTAAYSRHCEYTCDQYGKVFSSSNYKNGLLVLAAGKDLYKMVNIDAYITSGNENYTASARFIGICLFHPSIPKRIARLDEE